VNYHINVGEGYRRFGRDRQARQAFDRAVVLAERHQLNRELMQAEAARDAIRETKPQTTVRTETVQLTEATIHAQQAIEQMGAELAGAGV
jgi:hypothetical protein